MRVGGSGDVAVLRRLQGLLRRRCWRRVCWGVGSRGGGVVLGSRLVGTGHRRCVAGGWGAGLSFFCFLQLGRCVKSCLRCWLQLVVGG